RPRPETPPRRRRRSCGGPGPCGPSEVEVGAQPEVLDLVLVELAVGRVAPEVFEQDLEVSRGEHAVDLDAGPQREVGRPAVLLAVLNVGGEDRTPPPVARRPRADELQAVLDRPGIQAGGVAMEQVATASVDAERVAELVGDLQVHALDAQIDALGLRAEEELVAEVAGLVE